MTQYPYFYQPSLNLKLNDIKGTNIGSKNRINKFTGNNYELTTKDIPGCYVGSLKKLSIFRSEGIIRGKIR